jgi:alpha-beta hydrolase superfamily lysophospholipase
MIYKNYNIDERNKFIREYIQISIDEYIKMEYKKENNNKCILWIPGRNDYFFHYHFSSHFNNYDIYAVMFKNNHARRKNILHHIDNIKEHFIEIDEIYNKYNLNEYDEVILYGHSTGGLLCILYNEQNKKNKISKLILNSPFLKFKRHWIENIFLNYIGWYLFDFIPNIDLSFTTNKPNCYTLSLCNKYKINKKYKSYHDVPVISSWIMNNMKHHYRITLNEIKILVPTLILYCDKSINNNFKEKGDSILNIKENLKQVSKLFDSVTCLSSLDTSENLLHLKIIKDGVHDLLCSDGDIENTESQLGEVFLSIEKFLKI